MAADQLIDQEIQFKKRARRRLIGAVALVLLMVTVLPMVLDDRGGQKSVQPEIAISIPSQDGTDFPSKIVPVTPPAPQTAPVQLDSPVEKPREVAPPVQPAASAGKLAESKPAVVAPEKAVSVQAEPAAPVPKPTEIKPAVTAPNSAAEQSKPAVSDHVAAEKPKAAEEVKPETAKAGAQPKATAQTKSPATATTVKKGSVSVQVGVFTDAAKVKKMQAKIAEGGIHCYTENMKTPKGPMIRLRCGPFAGRAEAQQALDKLKAAGYGGILVTNQ